MKPLFQTTRLLVVVALLSSAASTAGQEVRVSRNHHAWGRFPPGAWILVREVSETFDERGHVTATTVTETRSTLLESDGDSYTTRVESIVQVAGKRIVAPRQIVKRSYDDLPVSQVATYRQEGPETIKIDGREIKCRVYEAAYSNSVHRTSTRTYFCSRVSPFVLRRIVKVCDVGGQKEAEPLSETTTTVIALDMPHQVLDEMKTASHLKVVHRHPRGQTISMKVCVKDVPGEVVSQWSKELDENDRVIRRSTLEIVDYGLPAVAPRPAQTSLNAERLRQLGYHRTLFGRWRLRRCSRRHAVPWETTPTAARYPRGVQSVEEPSALFVPAPKLRR